jgi:hypothetical protein
MAAEELNIPLLDDGEALPDWSILESPVLEPSPLDDLEDCSPDH